MIANVMAWIEGIVNELHPKAPVLEVGSLNVNGSVRPLFPVPYTGLDLQAGEGVDMTGDVLLSHFGEEFNTIVSTETLEHVTRPWVAVERMARWLRPDGYLIVSVPFNHPVHNHPSDYWRMTPEGLRVLFSDAGLATIRTAMDVTSSFGVAQRV